MATTTVSSIPKEIIELVPLYSGDKRQLNLYLRKCHYVIDRYNGSDEQNLYVFNVLTSRLRDNAAALLSEREDIATWSTLKALLIQHFGDPRSEECINIELESLKINSGESFLDFCNRIQGVRSLLMSKVNSSDDPDLKLAKAAIYNNTALNVFLYNLPENMVRIVRLKAPKTLEIALSIVLEEVNFLEQYKMRNRVHGNSQIMGLRPSMTQPLNYQPNLKPAFGNRPQLGSHPQQFGYRPPQQFGYRPPQQFGYRPPQQLGYRPPQQFGYRPPQQFGYKPPQPQQISNDVSMRTAPPKIQQGFNLNELTMTNCEENSLPCDEYYDYPDNDYLMDLNCCYDTDVNGDRREVLALNCDPSLKLPYIYLQEIDAKMMIDTGSMRSFLSPRKVYEYFSDSIRKEQFQVVSTHASSRHDEVIEIPLLPSFRNENWHKFYVYDVDARYDGLIGNDLLQQLDAIIDLKDQLLKTSTTCIPIINHNLNYTINIPARSEQRVKLPVNQYQGDAVLDFQEFEAGLRMPTAIVNCINGYACTVVQNTLDCPKRLIIRNPFSVIKYDNTECNIHFTKNKTDIEIDKILEGNLNKLRLDHTNDEEREKIYRLCQEYKDIFYCDQIPLTFTNLVKHQIRTKNEDPIYVKPYRQSPFIQNEICRQVDKLLKENVIKESHSPWSAPVHLVPKKMDASGEVKFRMVIDYRKLNDVTFDDKYPLPNINDLFDKLGKSTYFTTLDLASGYHQIEVDKKDRQKTAFSTQNGHFEFHRMPFGLKTAPATFQRTMDNVLRGLQGLHCMVYLDDIIIYGHSLDDMIYNLRTVFDRLRENNMKIQLDKSEFLRREVLYLGHTITKEGLRPNNDKINAVLDYPLPKTTTEIKSFLGLVGYYRRFIKDFAKITKPMTNCLKKRNRIIIDQEYIDSFNKCKELLTHAPLLQYPDYEKPFILTTDASMVAIGAVLSQGQVGNDKPIAYASRTLSDSESRYSTIERELLAIIWSIKHFRPYLYGRKFYIYTDHRPLVWLRSLKDPSSKLTRWRLRLQDFDYDLIYKNGKQNTNADALSRIKINALNSDEENQSLIVNIDQTRDYSDSSTVTISDLSQTATASSIDMADRNINHNSYPVRSGTSGSDTIHSALNPEISGIPILSEAIDTKPNQILVFSWFKNAMQVTDLSRDNQKVLEVFLPTGNTELIKEFVKQYIKPKIKYFIYFEEKEHRKLFSNIIIQLFEEGTVNFYECTERVVYVDDEGEQKAIISKHHEGKTCHRGIKETLARIRRNYYWDRMQETVTAVLNSCEACRKMKYDRKPIKPVLQLTKTQDAPFQELFIDLFSIEGKTYLTLIDAFSKLGQAIEIQNKSTPEVVRALLKYFSFYGIPNKISSDAGTEFNNALLKEFLIFHKIELHIGTPNNPNSMGLIERFHSTLIEIYRLAKYEKRCTDAASVMTYSVMAYNHSIHSVTELTPFEVVFGHTDTSSPYSVELEKHYFQEMVKEHAKRTKVLYKHLMDKMVATKQKIKEKKGGESNIEFTEGEVVYVKDINKRKSKDKPRYIKAKVIGLSERNILPLKVGERNTKTPIKNVKRPPQVLLRPASINAVSGPSSSKT